MDIYRENSKEKLQNAPDVFVTTYGVELCIEKTPSISKDKLLENIKKYCGKVEIMSEQNTTITFGFLDYVMEYKNATLPAAVTISFSEEERQYENLKSSLEQSWSFDINKEAIKNCKYSILVTDIMAAGLEYTKRIELFQKTLYSLVELIPCVAINFYITEQLISREDYLENNPLNDDYDPLIGILNVRLFNIEEGNRNEYLIDTLGLSAIGLCDLQCHFKNLDPNQISDILYSYGYYIFDDGDNATNMKTIQGIEKNQSWECEYEISIADPKRVVLDINPGVGFSGENRK